MEIEEINALSIELANLCFATTTDIVRIANEFNKQPSMLINMVVLALNESKGHIQQTWED